MLILALVLVTMTVKTMMEMDVLMMLRDEKTKAL